jgi:hypothetical protein
MGRIIKITESQLKRIVGNHINEQTLTTNVESGRYGDESHQNYISNKIYNALKLYPCIPDEFIIPFTNLISLNYDRLILKAALGVIGRESHFGSGLRYNTYGTVKDVWDTFGGNASHGPAQMTPTTAKDLGFTGDLNSPEGALDAAYRYLVRSYNKAISAGYTQSSSNVQGGTGNAAIDIAIASYNIGVNNIVKWCTTNDKNVNAPCNSPNKQYKPYPKDKPNYILTVSSQEIKNYIPNKITEKKLEGVSTNTHGYVKTVSDNMKNLPCF